MRLGARAQQVQVLNLGRLEPHRSKVQVLPLVTPGAQVQELSLVISGAPGEAMGLVPSRFKS